MLATITWPLPGTPHRHREPESERRDRAVIKNADGIPVPCVSEVKPLN